ncbi:MAG: hypothetical protein AYP45_04830 [Candidatus Brocadia carolinensis]|uniref:Uncharacterized protein n=1 Tax=Candidatus Brocadia carolinensis TaxID=1004156 RepID=A0A1V4AVP0_9BACT|nr:MAG: hypothetical protein AYP45_04830 [Candidatus Brocadia caroliniensis]
MSLKRDESIFVVRPFLFRMFALRILFFPACSGQTGNESHQEGDMIHEDTKPFHDAGVSISACGFRQ